MTLRFTHSTAHAQGGTARYQAPELFRGERPSHFGSDVYAFAGVCYEVPQLSIIFPQSLNDIISQILTGKVPFHELPNDMTVMFSVAEGKRPSQPLSCSGTTALESLWELLQSCWEGKAEMRPAAPQIVQRLVGPRIGATTTSSTTDWDTTFTSKFRRLLQAQPLLPSATEIEALIFGDG
jgi:serine/threonine protein kinase